MLKWRKLGQIFDPKSYQQTPDWMQEFAQSPSTIVLEEIVRVFFCTRGLPDSKGQYTSRIGYLDLDKKNLLHIRNISQEPAIPLGNLGTFDEFGTYPVSVYKGIKESRMYYTGFTRCESVPFNASIGLAIGNQDGENFQKIGEGPVLSFSPDEPFVLGSPRIRKFNSIWQLWYVAGSEWRDMDLRPEPIYKIRMAVSEDGIHWNKVGKNLIPDKIGAHECQACPDVFYKNGKYHMLFSYREIENYKQKEGGYRIGYASSSNLLDWSRDDSFTYIELSESGWDSEMINYPHVFEVENQVYMLYQGNAMGKEGFGLAVLEPDSTWSQS